MRADDLDHAVELQNAVPYGLTGGLHSLDDAEIDRWLARVEVGNVYVNRHTTGAIVRRQPFGGWKRSSVGRGAKTGGPDDILRFVTFRRIGAPPSMDEAVASYRHWWSEQFGRSIDRSGLRAESNVLRYRPVASGPGTCRPVDGGVRRDVDCAPPPRWPAYRSRCRARPGRQRWSTWSRTTHRLAARLVSGGFERLRLLGRVRRRRAQRRP